MRRRESQFCSELKQSAKILDLWFQKIPDTPRSGGNYIRFSVNKGFDIYLGNTDGQFIGIEAKSRPNFSSIPFSSVRDSEFECLQHFTHFGLAYVLFNFRVAGKNTAYAIPIQDLISMKDAANRKSVPYADLIEVATILPREKIDGTLVWNLDTLFRRRTEIEDK